MKLAGVSMTYNDDYKLAQWRQHYETYKGQLEHFIIVDNGSSQEYCEKLKSAFPEATLIFRGANGGCTAAYNDGIRFALEKTDVDAIAVIGNDIKLTDNCLPRMHEYLMSDDSLGIVSSAVLYINSEIIDNYGHSVKGINVTCCDQGLNIKDVSCKQKYTDLLSGGFTMAKREFYEKAGLQDAKLFMYCDELDTMFKARKYGYKLGVIADEYAWHWHINPPQRAKRSSANRYLISRNRVYLAKKYAGSRILFEQIVRGLIVTPGIHTVRFIKNIDYHELNDALYSAVGVIHGLVGKMYTNNYTEF